MASGSKAGTNNSGNGFGPNPRRALDHVKARAQSAQCLVMASTSEVISFWTKYQTRVDVYYTTGTIAISFPHLFHHRLARLFWLDCGLDELDEFFDLDDPSSLLGNDNINKRRHVDVSKPPRLTSNAAPAENEEEALERQYDLVRGEVDLLKLETRLLEDALHHREDMAQERYDDKKRREYKVRQIMKEKEEELRQQRLEEERLEHDRKYICGGVVYFPFKDTAYCFDLLTCNRYFSKNDKANADDNQIPSEIRAIEMKEDPHLIKAIQDLTRVHLNSAGTWSTLREFRIKDEHQEHRKEQQQREEPPSFTDDDIAMAAMELALTEDGDVDALASVKENESNMAIPKEVMGLVEMIAQQERMQMQSDYEMRRQNYNDAGGPTFHVAHASKYARSNSSDDRVSNDPSYCVLGPAGQYYIKYKNHVKWATCVTCCAIFQERSEDVCTVSFGSTWDTFFVVFRDGSWEYGGTLPSGLLEKLQQRGYRADLKSVTLGDQQQWCIETKCGKAWWSSGRTNPGMQKRTKGKSNNICNSSLAGLSEKWSVKIEANHNSVTTASASVAATEASPDCTPLAQ